MERRTAKSQRSNTSAEDEIHDAAGFPLASGGLGGFILVGQPSASVCGVQPRPAFRTSDRGRKDLGRERIQPTGAKPPTPEKDGRQKMDEIVQILQDRAGLSPDQAQEVAKVIVDMIKSKVPSEFQGMVDQYLGGGGDAQAGSNVLGGLGGLLGAAEGMLGSKG
jgi:hypothetical protein